MRRGSRLVLACAWLAALAACDNSGSSTTSPTPAAASTVETFNGTVQPGGSDAHTFTVSQFGAVNVTLTNAGPPPTIFMGLGIGSPASDGSCTVPTTASATVQAGSAPQLSGTAQAGTYCVKVSDIGNAAGPIAYTVTVAHS